MQNAYKPDCPCRRLENGVWTEASVSLAEECSLSVFVNGAPIPVLSCTPAEPEELVFGVLFTQGLITSRTQVQSLTLDKKDLPDALTASVTLQASAGGDARFPPSVIARSEATWQPAPSGKPERAVWTAEQLQTLFAHVIQDAPSTRGGHSTHSCTLMLDGEILCTREDIGRHNTISRAAGWALLHDVPLFRCVAFFSGRISTEAVRRAAAAGITVLCAKALPTAQAVALAQKEGLTLLHFSKNRGILQFC